MGILNILFHNSERKARTLRPADQTTPEGYRGALAHDASACTGCGTCVYVCSPGAIQVEKQPGGVLWQYRAIACTFCARCAQYCPTQAITLARLAPKTAIGERESLITRHFIAQSRCERCGQPFIPLPVPVLSRMLPHGPSVPAETPGDLLAMYRLCEKCRARATSERLKDSLTGAAHPGGGAA